MNTEKAPHTVKSFSIFINYMDELKYDISKIIYAELFIILRINAPDSVCRKSIKPFFFRNFSILSGSFYRWITNIIQMLYWCGVYEVPVLLSSDSHGYKQVGNVKGSEVLLGAYREVLDFPQHLIMSYDADRFMKYLSQYSL